MNGDLLDENHRPGDAIPVREATASAGVATAKADAWEGDPRRRLHRHGGPDNVGPSLRSCQFTSARPAPAAAGPPGALDSLPTALQNGRIDIIWSGMTATVERAKTLLFSDFYYQTALCLLVHAGSGIGAPAAADGKRLVVKLGTTGDVAAPRLFPRATVTRFEQVSIACFGIASLAELMAAARQVGAATYRNFEALLVVAGLYLTITLPLSLLARRLERVLARSQAQGGHL